MGKIPLENPQRLSMTSIYLLTNHVSIANLWDLDALGIKYPAEKRTREETAIAAKELFLQTVKVDSDGRYEISIHEDDRDFLRFLWTDSQGNLKVYRHQRVVFGISSSPFLLGASLEHHLNRMLENCPLPPHPFSKETRDEKALKTFIEESSILMAQGKFDLRGWEHTNQVRENDQKASTPVLGLRWNKLDDTLSLNQDDELAVLCLNKDVTKRVILSQAQRVFDPIGYTCPTTLIPKLLLQKTWKNQLTWDAPVDTDMATNFRNWINDLPHLSAIRIPRWINAGLDEAEQ
ncbi:hypothetical protein HUJ04_011319 [Dendroctonus ponderosae]|nr:hypothetical protein HUJ04_011319 [Dendroctonus ponderosae]